MNLGKSIYERVKEMPVFKSFPQKKLPNSFVVCPDKMVDLRQAGGDREFSHTVSVFSKDRQTFLEARDYIIRVGKEEIESGKWCLWLHAVRLSGVLRTRRERIFTGTVTYIFRTRKLALAEESLPEQKPEPESGSPAEAETAPEAPEKKKSKEEVK